VDIAAAVVAGINAQRVVLSLKDFDTATARRVKIQNSAKI
jgi:hypothetical protein